MNERREGPLDAGGQLKSDTKRTVRLFVGKNRMPGGEKKDKNEHPAGDLGKGSLQFYPKVRMAYGKNRGEKGLSCKNKNTPTANGKANGRRGGSKEKIIRSEKRGSSKL